MFLLLVRSANYQNLESQIVGLGLPVEHIFCYFARRFQ